MIKIGYAALEQGATNADIDSFVSGWGLNAEGCLGAGVVACGDVVYGQPGQFSMDAFGVEVGSGYGSSGASVTGGHNFSCATVLQASRDMQSVVRKQIQYQLFQGSTGFGLVSAP